MKEETRQDNIRIIKTFDKVSWPDERIQVLGRTIQCGAMRPRETMAIKKLALEDPSMLSLIENDSPMEQVGHLLTSESGYKLILSLMNLRIIKDESKPDSHKSNKKLTENDIYDVVDSVQTALELLSTLLAGKTIDDIRIEQLALEEAKNARPFNDEDDDDDFSDDDEDGDTKKSLSPPEDI